MIRIKIKTDGTKLTVMQPVVTSGSGGSVFVDFEFDSEWQGLNNTAVFSGGGKTYLALVVSGGCEFPSELLLVSGNVKIGVFGTDGMRTLTSLFCNVKISHGVPTDGAEAENYTPSLHEQLYAQINAITAEAKAGVSPDAKIVNNDGALVLQLTIPKGDKGDTGATGAKGENGVDGADGKDGADGYSPVRGVDYWTDADVAEIKGYVDDAILGGAW